jgi:hypothetical protein
MSSLCRFRSLRSTCFSGGVASRTRGSWSPTQASAPHLRQAHHQFCLRTRKGSPVLLTCCRLWRQRLATCVTTRGRVLLLRRAKGNKLSVLKRMLLRTAHGVLPCLVHADAGRSVRGSIIPAPQRRTTSCCCRSIVPAAQGAYADAQAAPLRRLMRIAS